jgi:uncharacterized protein
MLAVLLGLAVGLVIGGMGGGGGVLSVPVLIYLLGLGAQQASTASALIVGITSGAGVLARLRSGTVRWRTGLGLSAVGVPAAALGSVLAERVPEPVLLLSFAALTVPAAIAVTRDCGPFRSVPVPPWVLIGGAGLGIGFLTGFLGVGGGFLAVPALVAVLGLDMPAAVGTSLLVVTINAAAAVAARSGLADLDWSVVVPFTVAAVLASLLGKQAAEHLTGRTLARGFAALLIAVGAVVAVEAAVAL